MKTLKIEPKYTDDNQICSYRRTIQSYKLLSINEEVELGYNIRNNIDREKNINKLVKSNLRFVISVAKQYQYYGLELMQLIALGNMGLHKAAGMFDETKGFKFISYAVWWIRQCILQGLNNETKTVRVPANQLKNKKKLSEATELFRQKYFCEPTLYELSEFSEFSVDEINDMSAINTRSVTIDSPHFETDNGFLDILENKSEQRQDIAVDKMKIKKIIRQVIEQLPDKRMKNILTLKFGFDDFAMSIKMIADRVGESHQRTQQLYNKAIRILKNSNIDYLLEYI